MNSDENVEERHPVEIIAEEYSERIRNGEVPTIEEYLHRYPEHAELLQSILPSIAIVEQAVKKEDHVRHSETPSMSSKPIGIPDTLGDYKIVREIGRGGMGVVYEAIQKSLNRHVALKVISDRACEEEKHQSRFRREAESAASLHHTNIVPIYGIGEDQGLQYYAMQLIDGVTLHDLVECLQKDSHHILNETLREKETTTRSTTPQASSVSPNVKGSFQRIDAARWILKASNERDTDGTGWFTTSAASVSLTSPMQGI